MNTATLRFRTISTIMRDLNQAGLKMQRVNDLLTMYVGAASQHVLRSTFVPYEEAVSFDREIVAYWSQLAGRDVSSPLFHLPLRLGGLGVGSAVQRYAAAPWTAWKTVTPTLMTATDLTDTDSLFAPTPTLRDQLLHLQSTLAHQMNTPALLLKPLGAALRTHKTQKTLVSAIQRDTHKQIMEIYNDNPIQRAILISQTAKKHRRPPPAAQQRSIRSRRQMLSSLNGPTAYVAPPSGSPRDRHLCYVPQRQRGRASMHVPHRPTPTPLHCMQKRRRSRSTTSRTCQMPG